MSLLNVLLVKLTHHQHSVPTHYPTLLPFCADQRNHGILDAFTSMI